MRGDHLVPKERGNGWRKVVAAMVDGEVGRASGSVLHDEGHIMDEPQHKMKDETWPVQQLTERESWRRRNSDAAVVQRVLEQL
jgi:hypothetical protein